MKKVFLIFISGLIMTALALLLFRYYYSNKNSDKNNKEINNNSYNNQTDMTNNNSNIKNEKQGVLSNKDEIELTNKGNGKYTFKYKGETYTAIYTTDNWHINDSYKITLESDMKIICQALIDEHQIHGADMVSYRTPDDLAYEWIQHNFAYTMLPSDSKWKNNAKDVDLDPKDQGKSIIQMYEDKTGKKINLNSLYQ